MTGRFDMPPRQPARSRGGGDLVHVADVEPAALKAGMWVHVVCPQSCDSARHAGHLDGGTGGRATRRVPGGHFTHPRRRAASQHANVLQQGGHACVSWHGSEEPACANHQGTGGVSTLVSSNVWWW